MNDQEWMMPLAIGIIMFGIGLHLQFKDFERVFLKPKAILSGLFAQLVLLPLLAFGISYYWPISDSYKVGIILIAACPGGTISNLLTHFLKGKVALSVSLTAFNSFIIVLTIPLWMQLGFSVFRDQSQSIHLDFMDTFLEVLTTVIIPVSLGLLCRRYFSELSKRLVQPMNYIMPGLLLLVFIIALFFGSNTEIQQIELIRKNTSLLLLLLLLNISTVIAGFYFAGLMQLSHKSKYTIAIEMGLQNSALAIFIANNVLHSSEMVMVAVIYGSFTFFTTLFLGYFLKRRKIQS